MDAEVVLAEVGGVKGVGRTSLTPPTLPTLAVAVPLRPAQEGKILGKKLLFGVMIVTYV